MSEDKFSLGGREFASRLILGSGKYPLKMMRSVVEAGGSELVTVAVRRAEPGGAENILDQVPPGKTLIPNTSGARTAQEALTMARLARELGCGDFIKIEVIPDPKYLMPDNEETLTATRLLVKDGFVALPYINPDLVLARKLVEAGAAAVMPLGAPIGSNKGLTTKDLIALLVAEIKVPVIVDAGLGRPSQAAEALEMGVDAVMVNTAIATADDPPAMARAFALAVEAGRLAWLAGPGRVGSAEASSPLTGFLKEQEP